MPSLAPAKRRHCANPSPSTSRTPVAAFSVSPGIVSPPAAHDALYAPQLMRSTGPAPRASRISASPTSTAIILPFSQVSGRRNFDKCAHPWRSPLATDYMSAVTTSEVSPDAAVWTAAWHVYQASLDVGLRFRPGQGCLLSQV